MTFESAMDFLKNGKKPSCLILEIHISGMSELDLQVRKRLMVSFGTRPKKFIRAVGAANISPNFSLNTDQSS